MQLERRLLCERIAAQNMRGGQRPKMSSWKCSEATQASCRICWAKALAAPGYYLVEASCMPPSRTEQFAVLRRTAQRLLGLPVFLDAAGDCRKHRRTEKRSCGQLLKQASRKLDSRPSFWASSRVQRHRESALACHCMPTASEWMRPVFQKQTRGTDTGGAPGGTLPILRKAEVCFAEN